MNSNAGSQTGGGDTLQITVDTREPKKYYEFIRKAFPSHSVSFVALPEGDYATEHVRVERKTIADLYMSAMGQNGKKGRLQAQVGRLSTHSDEIVLFLITGSVGEFVTKMAGIGVEIKAEVIYGTIASICARERLHILWIEDELEGLRSMVKFMEKVERGQCMVPSRREPDILCARLLGVTLIQWHDLHNKFGSLARLACAKEKDLTTIYGIGDAKAKRILNILHGKE